MSSHSYDHDDRSPTAHSDLTTPTANETDGSPSSSFRGGPGPSSLRPSTYRPLASSTAAASPAVKTTTRSILRVHNHDVLSGRGVNIAHHPGNERFRTLVTTYTDKSYCTSYSVVEKKAVADQIIQHIKALDPPGRFLKREGKGAVSRALIGPWEELSQKDAVKKTCQALRDCNRQDRTGYAVAVKAPVDVKHAADRASKAGLSVKERAKAAASKLKKRESDYSLGHGYSRSQSHAYEHASSSNASKRGKTQQSLGVKRSRDELDNDYYASIYPSMPTSVSSSGVHPAAAAAACAARPESTHSRQDASHESNQSNAPMANQSSHHGVSSQQPHAASNPPDNFLDYTISAPISASQVAPPAEDPTLQGPTPPAGGYTSHNQHDHGSDPMYHNQEHSQNHYPHDNAHSGHGYSYPQSNPPNYSYGYEQNYGASDQYQNSYDPRGYYGGSSSGAPPYSHYPNYPPNHNQSHNPYSSMNSGHDHNYNHAHNQFRTVDESWALKKQRTDDTDPSLTSTAHSTTGTSASSPLDGSLDIGPSLMAPAPPAHTGNVAIHENVNDIFKDDSWTRGPAGDAGTDAGGIGVGPNTSMDGGFPDPMDDTLFSFDNEKY